MALINMGPGAVGGQVTISVDLHRPHQRHGHGRTGTPRTATRPRRRWTPSPYQVGNTPDIIASFSSRGPGVGNVLKPDIAAPGVNILAQGYDPTDSRRGAPPRLRPGLRHLHGGAARRRRGRPAQADPPDWSPAWIKSALMSTSKYMDIFTDADEARPSRWTWAPAAWT